MGGSVTDSGLPTTPHMHYVGSTMLHVSRTPHCVSHTAHCVGHTAQFVGRTAHCVSHTEYDKKHLVNIKFKIFLSVLAFSRVKK